MTHEPGGEVALACLAPSPTRCPAHTRLYRSGKLIAEGFPVEDISVHLAEPDTYVWLDLLRPSVTDMDVVVEELGLHPLAIEDALHDHQRPKLDRYPDHAFLAAYAVAVDPGQVQLRTGEVAAFLTDRALVTVRKDELLELEPLIERWDDNSELAQSGVVFLVHGLLDHLVDGHAAAVDVLSDESDALEDLLFDGSPSGELQRRTFVLRKALTHLRRAVVPMRDVLGTLMRHDVGIVDEHIAPYLRDVDDHAQRAANDIDALRDLLATLLDTDLTLSSNRLNETIFRLTAYAAILAATTAITGFFGQNVPFPGSQATAGFLGSTMLLLLSVAGLVVYFRRRGWL